MWASLGHHTPDGEWHVDGVTGPDEYSAVADDNVFTNLMAARNLRTAVAACPRHPDRAHALRRHRPRADRVGAGRRPRARAVRRAAAACTRSREGFTDYAVWDFEAYRDRYPLLLNAPYVQLYRKQVCKQADLVLALHWCGDALHRRGEGPRRRLLRAHHGARLVAVGVHAGGDVRRGGAPRARPRVRPRGRAGRPARPARQQPRRPAPRLAGRGVGRRGRGVRRAARGRRAALARPAAAARHHPPGVRAAPSGHAAAGRGDARAGHLLGCATASRAASALPAGRRAGRGHRRRRRSCAPLAPRVPLLPAARSSPAGREPDARLAA